jgi:aspartyl-tRNA(Asn)/glutamyl-tRNA(Gln) amidotransferase subunit A
MRIAVVREGHTRASDCLPEVGERFEAAIQVIREAGAHVDEIVIPYFDLYTTAQWVNNSAEKSGIYVKRYREQWLNWGRYTRVGMGSFGLFINTADYIQSLRARRHAQKALRELMEPYDAVLTPTFKGHIAKLADMKHPTSLGWPLYTSLWSWIGLPAIAVPMGLSNAGLPTSLQISGKPFAEATVFKVADAFQQLTDWHLQLPPVLQREALPA